MPRIRLDLAYDGNAYRGWAAQPGLPTVQGVLQEGLATLIRREVPVVVAGRTDAGVHARGQVVHFDLTEEEWHRLARGRDITPAEAMLRRIGGVLSRQDGAVIVHRAAAVPDDFDARFSALSRSYSYRLADGPQRRDPLRRFDTAWHPRALDEGLMDAEATSAVAADGGVRDFGSFCKPREMSTTVRQLQHFSIRRGPDDVLVAHLRADAFCHHMVRALIGACIEVGEGRREPGWVLSRLERPSWDSSVRLAPPNGLVLESVQYPDDDRLRARAEQTRALRPT
ncbi:tRNA pseudouridine synthase A [Nesterenkonia lacusekhoensis]|uniref:tRNA pseudouridine synthase A n=1 Tax=Nesterenkonia lacusekhoensis TaxID=150832 RepID=A0ABS4SYD0_9MICC|nr:tRNA pseudouridine synthase A [Nesterenkonia lacusekhoensis]MBP2317211.1 tRNA pseudouridine38-40 synthase [Nesterenkonia lacusekhoensis]